MFGSVWNSGKVLAAAVAILLAGGCGGSSSSSPPPPPPPPPPTNEAPTADAGPDQTVAEGSAVTLDGSGSADSDGTVDVYIWTQTGGTTVTLDLSTPSMPTFTAPQVSANEDLTFELVVTDNDGDDSAANTVVVTVTDVPMPPPTANAGPDQTVDEDTPVTLDGSGSSDSDGSVDTYSWTQTTGTAVTLDLTVPSMPTFTAPSVDANEDLTFELVVTDNDGQLSSPDTVVVTVTNVLIAPVADAGPDVVASSLDLVTLDGSASNDSDGTIESYAWTQTAGAAVTLDDTDPVNPTFTAPNVGADEILTFELVVTDNDGETSAADSVNVTINPTLALRFTDNFNDGNADGWTIFDDNIQNGPSVWSIAAGRYVQAVNTNTFGGDVDETYRRGTYSYLEDSVNLTDYRFEVEITRIPDSSDDLGVMFRFSDNDNYYRFSMNSESGSSRLESKINGTFVTLARNYRGYDSDQFVFNVAIEVEGPLIQVFVNNDPLFAATATDHDIGGVGLYSRDGVRFDNVSISVNDSSPAVAIASPVAYTVIPGGPRDIEVTAVARNVPTGGDVEFEVDSVPGTCGTATEVSVGVFTATCPSVAVGNRLIRANLRDAADTTLAFDNNIEVAVTTVGSGDKYDAIGDSITLGLMDKYRTDNLSLDDQRTIGFQGWAGVLGDLLMTATGEFNLVGNEGIPGDTSSTTRFQRLNSILERNPDSNRALVMLGTNDTNAFPAPTTPENLVANLENIANRLLNTAAGQRDRDRVYIASIPPVFGGSLDTPYPNPLDPSATRNQLVMDYNAAIQANAWPTDVILGPDFFSCFLTPTNNRFSLFADSLHPNGLGHAMMAALWAEVIINGPPTFPMDPCPSPVFILEDLDAYAHGHKQNLLEIGDNYYNDAEFTLTNIPAQLQGGVWVTQDNADNADATPDFLSFDVGSSPVTLYIAYDPAGSPPTTSLGPVTPSGISLGVSDPAIIGNAMDVVEWAGVTGPVTIGGTASGGGAASQAYVVIVVP